MRLCFTPCQKTQAVAWHKECLEKGGPPNHHQNHSKPSKHCNSSNHRIHRKEDIEEKEHDLPAKSREHWIKKECKVTKGEPQPQLHAQCRKILQPISQPEPKKIKVWHRFQRQKRHDFVHPQTLWIQDAGNVVCWAAFPGGFPFPGFPTFNWMARAKKEYLSSGEVAGGHGGPQNSWKHSGCEFAVQIPNTVRPLVDHKCCGAVRRYNDIDTLIFYDDIMLILWHCVTRCIRFPFLSPIFMHLQGPQNVMLIFSSFVLSSVSMVRIHQTKLRQEAGVAVETPQQHWSWARNINQLHFLKGLYKNINQNLIIQSDPIWILTSKFWSLMTFFASHGGVKLKGNRFTVPRVQRWKRKILKRPHRVGNDGGSDFIEKNMFYKKKSLSWDHFFQGVFEMFLQNLWNVTTGDCFFLASRPRSLEESNDLENVWWFDHSKCLPLKQAAHQAPFQAALAWLYLGFIAVPDFLGKP